jgi:hypothetical protein
LVDEYRLEINFCKGHLAPLPHLEWYNGGSSSKQPPNFTSIDCLADIILQFKFDDVDVKRITDTSSANKIKCRLCTPVLINPGRSDQVFSSEVHQHLGTKGTS